MFLRTGLIALLLSSSAALAAEGPSHYPLTIDNCGETVSFDAAPGSAVTVGQAATEILYVLGLGDKVAGTSVWFSEVLPEFADLNAGVERLADNDPSFESVVAKKPGLVVAQYEWHVGPEGIVATRQQFHDLAIPTYVLPADCVAKDNTVGSDGTRRAMFSTESVHQGVRELAQIFDVQAEGEALVADLKAREAIAVEKAAAVDLEDVSALFWFSSPEIAVDPYVAGRKGAPGYMMEALGLRNVVESDEEWPTVGWESLAKADPTVIVIAKMDRRRFAADDFEKKLEFLKSDPVTREMTAVKEGRIVVMDAHTMDPTIRTVSGIEQLAEALQSFGLTQ